MLVFESAINCVVHLHKFEKKNKIALNKNYKILIILT